MLGRRGASEIIAAMLLILITVAAAVLLYAYSSGLMGRLQGAAVSQPYLEQVSLDYYDWTSCNSNPCPPLTTQLNLTLRNVGAAKVTMSDFYISGTRNTTALKFGTGCKSPQGVLNVQGTCWVSFPLPTGFSASPGIAYTVKIVSRDGAIFSYSCIAGQAA